LNIDQLSYEFLKTVVVGWPNVAIRPLHSLGFRVVKSVRVNVSSSAALGLTDIEEVDDRTTTVGL
jgi:hypothetical protein